MLLTSLTTRFKQNHSIILYENTVHADSSWHAAVQLCLPRAPDSMFCIDFVRITHCFYDYDFTITKSTPPANSELTILAIHYYTVGQKSAPFLFLQ